MGAAMAGGWAKTANGDNNDLEIMVSNPTEPKLMALKEKYPIIATTTDNCEAARWGDIVILAVKPWSVEFVIDDIKPYLNPDTQQIVSIAAGVGTERIRIWLEQYDDKDWHIPIHYVIPNTAISVGESMTFVASSEASDNQIDTIVKLFERLGKVMIMAENDFPAGIAIASCGIAYAMRYARANMEGAIGLGIKPAKALEIIVQTMLGTAKLLQTTGSHPEVEIDRVTTPGGLSIKGLFALEENGFTTAIIKALAASLP